MHPARLRKPPADFTAAIEGGHDAWICQPVAPAVHGAVRVQAGRQVLGADRCDNSRAVCRLHGSTEPAPARRVFFDNTTASSTKSHFDLRPKAPPSKVTLILICSGFRPVTASAIGISDCGSWLGAQISQKSAVHRGNCRRRLHRSMRQVRRIIFSFQRLLRRLQCLLNIALLAQHVAGLPDGFQQSLLVTIGIIVCVRTIIPFDLEQVAAASMRPNCCWR